MKISFIASLRFLERSRLLGSIVLVYLTLSGVRTGHAQALEADKMQTQTQTQTQTQILILFQSDTGGTYHLAKAMANGVASVPGANPVLRQVRGEKPFEPSVPVARVEEIGEYDGIALGSAVHFGGSTPEMRLFWKGSLPIWNARLLEGKPATVFMSAGSGYGREAAVMSLWSLLASHGMVIVPTGMMGIDEIDRTLPQGVNPFGTVSLGSTPGTPRPSPGELHVAKLQGIALAKAATAVRQYRATQAGSDITRQPASTTTSVRQMVNGRIAAMALDLKAPEPAGNYLSFKQVDNVIYINQVALVGGKILYPGAVGRQVSDNEARRATRLAMTNVLAVLEKAVDGDWGRVRQTVQLTAFFNAAPGYTGHAELMNEASDLVIDVLGMDVGKHTRATVGASSLPLDSPVEIQAVFEVSPPSGVRR